MGARLFSTVSARVCLFELATELSSLVFEDETLKLDIILETIDSMLLQRLVKPEIAVDAPFPSNVDPAELKLLASDILAIVEYLGCQGLVAGLWRYR